MKPVAKARLTKVLMQAQDEIVEAYSIARRQEDRKLCFELARVKRELGDMITAINGGPIKISAEELTR